MKGDKGRHEEGIQFTEIQPREEVRYGEELEERKAQDIFLSYINSRFHGGIEA